jgi:gamma-glutamyltranspeptidase/glutathione hydrolase
MNRAPSTRGHWRQTGFVVSLIATSFLLVGLAQVPLQDQQPARSALRPAVMGPSGGVSTGHPLTTAAAFEILLRGGNAFDAGVAALLAGGVLEQDLYSLGGEALVLVYPKKEGKVTSVVGQGWAPQAVDVDWYVTREKNLTGEGLDPAVVPGAVHAALTVLDRWGTMSFEDVAAREIKYAEHGFPTVSNTQLTLPTIEKE